MSRLSSAFGLVTMLGIAVAATHCGSSSNSFFTDPRGTPCTTVHNGKCGKSCASDGECPEGLYCGAGNTCTADCASGYPCAGEVTCSARGRCGSGSSAGGFGQPLPPAVGDPPGDAGVCADIDLTLAKILPKVVFLLDQSSSMHIYRFPTGDSNDCTNGCRWTVLKDVLIGPAASPGGLLKQLESEAEIAVEMYSATDPNPNDDDNSYLSGPTDNVCPRFNGRAFDGLTFSTTAFTGVDAILRPASVDDDTPTGPAVRKVVGLGADGSVADPNGFAGIPGSAPKVLVLVTDGEPMLCGENYASDPGRAAVVEAVRQTYAQNIRTFVIAIGDVNAGARQHFNEVANAGQGKPASGDARAILPDTPQKLVDALKAIVLDARTCTFDLNGKVEEGKEHLGTVTLNGTVVPFDAPGAPDEGWRLVNPSRIELVGAACTTLKSTPNAQLSARFPCGAASATPPTSPK